MVIIPSCIFRSEICEKLQVVLKFTFSFNCCIKTEQEPAIAAYCTAHTVWSDQVIRLNLVLSIKFTTTYEKQKKFWLIYYPNFLKIEKSCIDYRALAKIGLLANIDRLSAITRLILVRNYSDLNLKGYFTVCANRSD